MCGRWRGRRLHYTDDGVAQSVTVLAGEPLLQRKFSLARLSWITRDGPKPGISAEAIQACFGLRWNASAHEWEYIGDKTTVQSTIKTLQEVAAAGRDRIFSSSSRPAF